MPQSKKRHAEWMRERRGAQDKGAQTEGAQDWETILIKEIKEILPEYLVKEIEALAEYDRIRQRPLTLEDRFRIAYKYHVWHEGNFTNGIHKDLA